MSEIYVSTDIEADGPIPGPYSMLSFGSAAFTRDGTLIGTFTRNLQTLPDATQHPSTMEWWATQPKAWEACRVDLQDPAQAMTEYREWLKSLPGKTVFVGYPAAYDHMWIHWYLIRFGGEDPMGFSALDIKSFAMALLGKDFRATTKRAMPRRWFSKDPHNHVSLVDAIGQGRLFLNMLRENLNKLHGS